MKLTTEQLEILKNGKIEENRFYLQWQLDRKQYTSINEVLETIWLKWNKWKKAHIIELFSQEDLENAVNDVIETWEVERLDNFRLFNTLLLNTGIASIDKSLILNFDICAALNPTTCSTPNWLTCWGVNLDIWAGVSAEICVDDKNRKVSGSISSTASKEMPLIALGVNSAKIVGANPLIAAGVNLAICSAVSATTWSTSKWLTAADVNLLICAGVKAAICVDVRKSNESGLMLSIDSNVIPFIAEGVKAPNEGGWSAWRAASSNLAICSGVNPITWSTVNTPTWLALSLLICKGVKAFNCAEVKKSNVSILISSIAPKGIFLILSGVKAAKALGVKALSAVGLKFATCWEVNPITWSAVNSRTCVSTSLLICMGVKAAIWLVVKKLKAFASIESIASDDIPAIAAGVNLLTVSTLNPPICAADNTLVWLIVKAAACSGVIAWINVTSNNGIIFVVKPNIAAGVMLAIWLGVNSSKSAIVNFEMLALVELLSILTVLTVAILLPSMG